MLELINIHKTFNKGTVNERKALSDLNLHLDKGDFVTIIGSNGAGKSTMFNAIGGSYIADTGKIILDGEDITFKKEYKRSRQIGRLFQDPLKGTAPSMTIEENLMLAHMRSIKGSIFKRPDTAFYTEKLSHLDMGLEDRMKTKVGTLSGGQRQAITLLMATISSPKLLLLDEHTAALDPATAEKVIKLTEIITKENTITTLMITHNIKSALEIGNRTIMMNAGKVILDIKGDERKQMTVEKLLMLFKEKSSTELDNDRIILS